MEPRPVEIEGRFSRLEAIEWWDQERLARARVLVIGAGALGNEVLKNLSLLGVGHVVVVDRDRVERSNLSRSALFREADRGEPKALCAARSARELYPDQHVQGLACDVLADVGLGLFRWADVVVGALDNREARVFVNSACARVGRPWVDGGIDVFQGIARGFAPPRTACYECTMSKVDWQLIEQRRSCALLARRAAAQRGTPTTPTVASVVGAVQAQEVVKLLHGMDALLGRGWVFDGAGWNSYVVNYPQHPDCPWHEPPAPVETWDEGGAQTPLAALWQRAEDRLGALDALDLSRELVDELVCAACGARSSVRRPLEAVSEGAAACTCGAARQPTFLHSVGRGSELLAATPAALGLPPWDVVWARRGAESIGFEMTADRERVLGSAGGRTNDGEVRP